MGLINCKDTVKLTRPRRSCCHLPGASRPFAIRCFDESTPQTAGVGTSRVLTAMRQALMSKVRRWTPHTRRQRLLKLSSQVGYSVRSCAYIKNARKRRDCSSPIRMQSANFLARLQHDLDGLAPHARGASSNFEGKLCRV